MMRSSIEAAVTVLRASVGETETMVPPATALAAQDLSQFEVRARASQVLVARLQRGEPVRAQFPAAPIVATVCIRRTKTNSDQSTRTAKVIARVTH